MIGADHLAFQGVALRFAAALALGAAGLTGGCAASGSYMGLNLTAPDLPVELRDLARRAQAGDKQAQFELGVAFEEGRGVARDLGRAHSLFTSAAADDVTLIYTPAVGTGALGSLSRIVTPGSGNARARQSLSRMTTQSDPQ